MSWKLFKVNMLLYMNNPIGIATPVQFATKLATEYDSCMRRGGQLIGKESILMGNLPLMLSLLGVAQSTAITKGDPGKHAFLLDVGNAVKGYWTGATLNPFPIYPIPAPGSIQNIVINSAMVTNPGTWPQVPFEIPTNSALTFLEAFVMFAKIHLFTLQGMFMTTSLYPSAPAPVPAPGVANWVGYKIPDVPMFGISKDQDSNSETNVTADTSNSDGSLSDNTLINSSPNIRNKPKPIIISEAERKAGNGKFPYSGLSLNNMEDMIDNQLRNELSGQNTNGEDSNGEGGSLGGGTSTNSGGDSGNGANGGNGGNGGNEISLDTKLDMVINAERKKIGSGLDRFYSDAIKAIGDFKNTSPDIDSQFQKSLNELQRELQNDKDNCCDDC